MKIDFVWNSRKHGHSGDQGMQNKISETIRMKFEDSLVVAHFTQRVPARLRPTVVRPGGRPISDCGPGRPEPGHPRRNQAPLPYPAHGASKKVRHCDRQAGFSAFVSLAKEFAIMYVMMNPCFRVMFQCPFNLGSYSEGR